MIDHRPFSTLVFAGFLLLALASCDTGDDSPSASPSASGGTISLLRPPAMLDFRAIDRSQLFPEVVVDGRTRTAERAGDGVWRVRFTAPPNSRVDVTITWFERFEGEDLPLVRSSFPITVVERDVVRRVSATEYDGRAFDADQDDIANIDERRAGSDPFVAAMDDDAPPVDGDGDGVPNDEDNCATVGNADQEDRDDDGVGDVCDADIDGDGLFNDADNCPGNANPDQGDDDADGLGNVCDDGGPPDRDSDGVPDDRDNCVDTPNPDQRDSVGNGVGDACRPPPPEPDRDGDGVPDDRDNCVDTPNPDQRDSVGNGVGDACRPPPPEPDRDNDGVPDDRDNCIDTPNPDQRDSDGNAVGDACQPIAFTDEFSGEIRLAFTKSPLDGTGGSFSVEDDSGRFETRIGPGGASFEDFFFLFEEDPEDENRRTYLELAIVNSGVNGNGDLSVRLRSLMFVELLDSRDDSGERIRIVESERFASVTVMPGEVLELRASTVGSGELRSVLAPSVSTENARWQGSIDLTLRYGVPR